MSKYREAFRREEIMYDDLKLLQDVDLEKMNILIGPRRRLLEQLAHLPEEVDEEWIVQELKQEATSHEVQGLVESKPKGNDVVV